MEQEISDNNICRKHEVREQGTEAGSQGLMTEDPKQAITNVCQGFFKQTLYLWVCKGKTVSFIYISKTPGKPTVYLMSKNESGLCRALDFKRQLIQDSRCLAGTS